MTWIAVQNVTATPTVPDPAAPKAKAKTVEVLAFLPETDPRMFLYIDQHGAIQSASVTGFTFERS